MMDYLNLSKSFCKEILYPTKEKVSHYILNAKELHAQFKLLGYPNLMEQTNLIFLVSGKLILLQCMI